MKKNITYIIFLLITSWAIGFGLSTFYTADIRLEWGHIYMWTPAILTFIWIVFNKESIKILKWKFKKPWWIYIMAIYLPLLYIVPETFIQHSLGFISYDFSTHSFLKEFGVKIPFAAIIGIGIPVLGEELGWRGYLQDKLVNGFGQIKGIFLLGFIWAIWHLPVLFQQEEDWLFTAFVFYPLFCISLSFIIYWAMTKCNSIWIAVFIHAANNHIWGSVYDSATFQNNFGAKIISLTFFVLIILIFVFLLKKKASENTIAPSFG